MDCGWWVTQSTSIPFGFQSGSVISKLGGVSDEDRGDRIEIEGGMAWVDLGGATSCWLVDGMESESLARASKLLLVDGMEEVSWRDFFPDTGF